MRELLGVYIVFLCLLINLIEGGQGENRASDYGFPTVFAYNLGQYPYFEHLPVPNKKVTPEDLVYWNQMLDDLLKKYPKPAGTKVRAQAYLYNAQRDFAFLSYKMNGRFAGSIGPVSAGVLKLFFPEYVPEFTPDPNAPALNDIYSKTLARVVLDKVKDRFSHEQPLKPYPILQGAQYWSGKNPIGLELGNLKPWSMSSSSLYRSKPPPPLSDSYWKDQINQIKAQMNELTPEKKDLIYYWAGMTTPGSGDWQTILEDYLKKLNARIGTRLLVRSTLAMGIYDATAGAFDTKYTYWIKRPSMIDDSIKPVIDVPEHPSYPSAHSSIAGASSTILIYFFPENQEKWNQLAIQSGMSRIWAGIHYPNDHEEGIKLGKKVGEITIAKSLFLHQIVDSKQ